MSWKPGCGGRVPAGAVKGGLTQHGDTLFIGRATVEGQLAVGKVSERQERCGRVGSDV